MTGETEVWVSKSGCFPEMQVWKLIFFPLWTIQPFSTLETLRHRNKKNCLTHCVLIQPDKAVMKGNWQSLYPYCHLMVTNTTYRQLPAAKTKRILCTSVTAAVFQHSHACQYVKTEVYLISKNTFLGNSENHECQKYLQNIIA